MLNIKLFGENLICKKSRYSDETLPEELRRHRLAILLFDAETGELFGDLTTNLPNMNLMVEDINEASGYESFIDHQPMDTYENIIEEIKNVGLIKERVGEAKSGFNHYLAFEFDKKLVDQMDDCTEL